MCVSAIDTQFMQWFFIGKSFAFKKKNHCNPQKIKLDVANESKKFSEKRGLKLPHYEEKYSEVAIFRQQLPTYRQKYSRNPKIFYFVSDL